MIRLLRVELTRLRWRRAVLVLLGLCVVVPVLMFASMAWNTRPVSAEELRRAQTEFGPQSGIPQAIDQCARHPDRFGVPSAPGVDTRAECSKMLTPDPAMYFGREPLDVEQQRTSTGIAVATLLIGLVMLLGTTFVGHDWNTGSMSNQLLFEPRRLRIWGAKALVVAALGLVVALVGLTAFWVATDLLAHSRDLTVPRQVWADVRGSVWRSAVLAAAAGTGAYALTMFFRSTVATLGIMFGFSVAGTIVTLAILRDGGVRWLVPMNVNAWLVGGVQYYDQSRCVLVSGGESNCQAWLSQNDAGLFLLSLLLVAVALSLWSFRRRDVP